VTVPPIIGAFMLSCPEREAVRSETLAAWAETDWGLPPIVHLDRHAGLPPLERIARAGFELLSVALGADPPLVLLLEDDLRFNRHLRENLERWSALRGWDGGHFFGTLYNGGLPALAEAGDAFVVAAAHGYGGQALLVGRATLAYALEHWSEVTGAADTRLWSLAARVTPLRCHRPSLVQHVGVTSVCGNAFHQAEDFGPTWRARAPVEAIKLDPTTAAAELRRAAGALSHHRAGSGAGIAMVASGLRDFVDAWLTFRRLRQLGCRLPGQLWHVGPTRALWTSLLGALGVVCVEAGGAGNAGRPGAIVGSGFRHVLYLDPGTVPLADPTPLLDSPAYHERGALFWPDRPPRPSDPVTRRLAERRPVWGLTGLAFQGDPRLHVGQLCVDTERCWRELALALWMRQRREFFDRLTDGDADAFLVAWRLCETAYATTGRPPRRLGAGALGQHDFDGRLIFQHGAGPGSADDRPLLVELRAELDRRERSARAPYLDRLCLAPWILREARRPPRTLQFGRDGQIGGGGGRRQARWTIEGQALYLLDVEGELTRLLVPDGPARWRSPLEDGPSSALLVPI